MVSTSIVLEALRRHDTEYRRRHGGSPRRLHVLERLLACRTGALGGHLLVCTKCDLRLPVYTSCDDRHCPQCGAARSAEWLDKRAERMLPVPHFQVVFTVPSQLNDVANDNPTVVYALMLRVGASVLQDLAKQRMGARVGITEVLHTWASNLTHHPHVHCLITAGGLTLDDDEWVPTRNNYLFPVKVIARMYRGRLLKELIDAHQAGRLRLRGDPERAAKAFETKLRRLSRRYRQWGVHVAAPEGRPALHALKYLARYIHRVAITDHRMVSVTDSHVSFRARDADSDGKQRTLRLEGHEFVRRVLLHVLPRGFHKVRHYGLYAPANAKIRLPRAHTLVGLALPEEQEPSTPAEAEPSGEDEDAPSDLEAALSLPVPIAPRCPACGAPMTVQSLPSRRPAIAARDPP